jgi:hypothetical protein
MTKKYSKPQTTPSMSPSASLSPSASETFNPPPVSWPKDGVYMCKKDFHFSFTKKIKKGTTVYVKKYDRHLFRHNAIGQTIGITTQYEYMIEKITPTNKPNILLATDVSADEMKQHFLFFT